VCIGCVLLLGVACDATRAFSLHERRETKTSSAPETDARESLLTEANLLREAMRALDERLVAPISALEVMVFEDRLLVQVQDFRHPDRVVQYQYRQGRVSAPIPVKLRGPGQLGDNLFPLRDVNFAGVSRLAEQAVSKVASARGHVRYLVVRRNLPITMDVRFRVFVTSPERDLELEADANARLLDPS
jgi:hypothetical protein